MRKFVRFVAIDYTPWNSKSSVINMFRKAKLTTVSTDADQFRTKYTVLTGDPDGVVAIGTSMVNCGLIGGFWKIG